jgi:hypothetical protein
MYAKTIAATVGFIIFPLLVSMSGVQQEDLPAETQASNLAKVQELSGARTIWAQNDNSQSRLSYFTESSNRRSEEKKIKEAAKALRQAETSDEQEAARATLNELLGADYDSRLADYEVYLEKLEQQLSDMREKLSKRRDAKAKMVELRIKVLEAEADDLGWPSRMNGRFGSSLFPARIETTSGVRGFSRFEPRPRETQPAQPAQPKQPNIRQ